MTNGEVADSSKHVGLFAQFPTVVLAEMPETTRLIVRTN